MSKVAAPALLLLLFASLTPAAQPPAAGDRFGAGFILGEPTGLSLKYWLSERVALDGAVAWSFVADEGRLFLSLDYLYHSFQPFEVQTGMLPLVFGLGGQLTLSDEPDFGLRVPIGLTYIFENVPLDLFAEVAPALLLLPATDFALGAGVGVRYYF